jgi:hypothetical protein
LVLLVINHARIRILGSTAMEGTVQGYFDRAFNEMPDKRSPETLSFCGTPVSQNLQPHTSPDPKQQLLNGSRTNLTLLILAGLFQYDIYSP